MVYNITNQNMKHTSGKLPNVEMKTKVDGNQGHADGQSKKSGRVELFIGVPNSSFMTNLFSTIVDLFMYIMYNIVLTH
jgi:hypothetical protein